MAFFDRGGFGGPDVVGGALGLHDLLSSNCRIFPIRLGRLPPRTPAFFACASHVSLKSLSRFLPRDDRRLQPWLLLLGRGGCSLGSVCVERAGHGPNRSLHARPSSVPLRDPPR